MLAISVQRLDHINIRTNALEATKAFYVDVLGLRVGERPPFAFPGYWLYDDRVPVIHLSGTSESAPGNGTGPIDHVAFRLTGLHEMRERLVRRSVRAQERVVPRTGDIQIFVEDPNGVTLELTFDAAEVPHAGARADR